MAKLGFIGLGLMGLPMCHRLLQSRHSLTLWNRSPDKAGPLINEGASLAGSIPELVAASDVIMMCVSDTDAVRSIVFGDSGIASCIQRHQILVDFSSVSPVATQVMARELAEATGAEWVDAPVSGGVAGAEAGTLVVMAGGSPGCVERITPILSAVSQRVTRMGDVGAGQITKVCNQMLVSCNVLVMAEMMALAEKAGVSAEQIPAALAGGFADSIPLQLTGSRMASKTFLPVKWHVKTLLKDLDMANELARNLTSATPMTGLGSELMRQHASQGNQDCDPSTLVEMYLESVREA